jgi:hypothetical protein
MRRDSNGSQTDNTDGFESRKRTTQSLLEYLNQKNRKQFLGLRRQAPGTAPNMETNSRELSHNEVQMNPRGTFSKVSILKK